MIGKLNYPCDETEKLKASLTFTVFADFHYKECMYLSSVADMNTILESAKFNNAEFVIHGGDLCNDYSGSPELVNSYLKNDFDLPAYGVYGNHELETKGNSMAVVTPLLTNRSDSVIWGTADGKIGDGSIGYYYFDKGDYRIVCTDSNYSYNSECGEWQHNAEASWGGPRGNIYSNSLSPMQLNWVEKVITDAAERGKHCIVISHDTFNTDWNKHSPDSEAICKIYQKANAVKKGTVIMSINGHYHTNRMMMKDDVVFFDVNTVRNGFWQPLSEDHYTDDQTFEYISYDADGKELFNTTEPLKVLWQSTRTWFFDAPLYATVRIFETGEIEIDGTRTKWIYSVEPDNATEYAMPEITSKTFKVY